MARLGANKLLELGMPAPKPRQTYRTYFKGLAKSDPEGWLEKARGFTGESESAIRSELRAKRKVKTKPRKEGEPKAQGEVSLSEIIEIMTTAEEARDFVRSSPSISQDFLNYVLKSRKGDKRPRR